jgi:hypothetical protein
MTAAEVRGWWLHGTRPWFLVLAPTVGLIAALDHRWVLAVILLAAPVAVTVVGLVIGGSCARCGLDPRPCDACRARVVEDW